MHENVVSTCYTTDLSRLASLNPETGSCISFDICNLHTLHGSSVPQNIRFH